MHSDRPTSTHELMEQAMELAAAGQLPRARQLVAECLKREPQSAAVQFVAGTLAHMEGGTTPAIEHLQAAIDLDSRWPNPRIALARVYLKTGNHNACRRAAQDALQLDPDAFDAHLLLAHSRLRGPDYHRFFALLHRRLRPCNYLETGVAQGDSIRLTHPQTIAVGIDPQPQIADPLPAHIRIFAETSDAFFSRPDVAAVLGNQPLAIGFIDGMHLFEFALRDFFQMERIASMRGVIFVHDCFPINQRTAERQRATRFWSGDVWKLIVCLKQERPDLQIDTLNCPPTGLGMIRRLDPSNRRLANNYETIRKRYQQLPYDAIAHSAETALNLRSMEEKDIPGLIREISD